VREARQRAAVDAYKFGGINGRNDRNGCPCRADETALLDRDGGFAHADPEEGGPTRLQSLP
jgi:hypothetical protein